jgi:hypothetical protein
MTPAVWKPPVVETCELPAQRMGGGVANTETQAKAGENGQVKARKPFQVQCNCGEWMHSRAASCPGCGVPRPASAKKSKPEQSPPEKPQTAAAAFASLCGQVHVEWATGAAWAILEPLNSDQRAEVLAKCRAVPLE